MSALILRPRLSGPATAVLCTLVLLLTAPARGATAPGERVHAGDGSVEVVLTSADLKQALTRVADVHFSGAPPGSEVIAVNPGVRMQRIKGVGGAMTDTSAWLIDDALSRSTRRSLLNALFGASGIHLNFIRVPMGASDFTAARTPYSYDDMPSGHSDPALTHFSIRHDTRYTIPVLTQALSINPGAFVLANPWSPPAWMKTDDIMGNPNGLGRLKRSSSAPLAAYFVKFLQAYAARGIHVDAITPQNEPGQTTTYPGVNMSESDEAAFVRYHLAPALRSAKLNTRIYGYDWGWASGQIPFADQLATSRASADLAGIATHCYFGDPTTMSVLHGENRRLDEIVDECSPGIMSYSTSELEIASMRNWASAVALWNLALDPSGGPVQPPNSGCPHCTGIVTVNEATHRVTLTRAYYQLGQVSRFVAPGAVRIGSNSFVKDEYRAPGRSIATPGVDDVAFQNPDGSRVLVAYNNSAAAIGFAVNDAGRSFGYTLEAGTTGTFVWRRPG